MATNPYFPQGWESEQEVYWDLIEESISIYGQDVYYLPRTVISEESVIGEPSQSYFDTYFEIEMYIDNFDGFGGEGNLFSKFGIEIRDQMNLIVSVRRWNSENPNADQLRPYEGDLIYFPLNGALFEIAFVEDEEPFYQLNNLPVFQLQCEQFEYNGQAFNTGIPEIDQLEYNTSEGRIFGINLVEQSISPAFENGTIFYNVANLSQKMKLYSTEINENSPKTYEYSAKFGQLNSTVQVNSIWINSDDISDYSVKIQVMDLFETTGTDEQLFPNDPAADNAEIENEADNIIDFSEDNPFGEV